MKKRTLAVTIQLTVTLVIIIFCFNVCAESPMTNEAFMLMSHEEQETWFLAQEAKQGYSPLWSLEDKLVLQEIYGLPDDDDISEEGAISIAVGVLSRNYDLTDEQISEYTPYVWFAEIDKINFQPVYAYIVDFGTAEHLHKRYDYADYTIWLNSQTGEVLDSWRFLR